MVKRSIQLKNLSLLKSGKEKIIGLFWVLSAGLILSSCDHPGNEEVRLVKEAYSVLDNYFLDIKKEGLTAEFRYLDKSPDFYWVPPGYSYAANYDSIVVAINRNAKQFKKVDNSWQTLQVHFLSPEYVSYNGKIASVVTDTTGKTSAFELIETGLMVKREDGWKLLRGQTTLLK